MSARLRAVTAGGLLSGVGPASRANLLASLFMAGGLLILGVIPLTVGTLEEGQRWMLATLAGLLVLIGLGASVRGVRLRRREEHALSASAALIVTAGALVLGDSPLGGWIFYVWVVLGAAYLFPTRAALAHVALCAVGFATVLLVSGPQASDLSRFIGVVGTLIVIVVMLGWMKRLLNQRLVELERSRASVAESNEMLRSTLEATADGILVLDDDGSILSHNQRVLDMWRIPAEMIERRDYAAVAAAIAGALTEPTMLRAGLLDHDAAEGDHYALLKVDDGRTIELHTRPRAAEGKGQSGWVLSFRDISERERVHSQLQHMAQHDALTGLVNRQRFEQEVDRHLARADRYDGSGAVLLIDLDEFKDINDSLGHRAGDAVLLSVAEVLRERLRRSDAIARLGGDEFAVLLPEAADDEAVKTAECLVEAIRTSSATHRGHSARVTASIGVASTGPDEELGAESVLIRASLALYEAKDAGRDRVHAHGAAEISRSPGDGDATRTWADRIRRALDQDALLLHAQPILDVASDRIASHELLVRMVDDDGSLLAPARFLPAAERSGLIADIDFWVFEQAVERIRIAEGDGLDLCLEVNLSGKTIGVPELPSRIESTIEAASIDPSQLIFEITETTAVRNLEEARRFAQQISAFGCRFALDDFGAGFGSFYYLKYLPFDYLKIDGDFIANLPASSTDQAVVRAIVDLARRLGKRTIAEFVTSLETLRMLAELGVDHAQGSYIGRPRPIERVLGMAVESEPVES